MLNEEGDLNQSGHNSLSSGFSSRGAVDVGALKNSASWRAGVLAIISCQVLHIRWPEIRSERISRKDRIRERSFESFRTSCEALGLSRSRLVRGFEND